DTGLLRNAIRLEAIPAIERATGRTVRDTFARTAGLLRADADTLWQQACVVADGMVAASSENGEHVFAIEAEALAALSPPMASRVVRRAFQLADLPWTEATIDAVVDLAAGRPGRRRDLQSGLRVERDREYVRGTGPALEAGKDPGALDRSQGDTP
ncbi:MAG TPA: TilS substrate-binding domain-containing protein, partial [Actinomycetota bacterium]